MLLGTGTTIAQHTQVVAVAALAYVLFWNRTPRACFYMNAALHRPMCDAMFLCHWVTYYDAFASHSTGHVGIFDCLQSWRRETHCTSGVGLSMNYQQVVLIYSVRLQVHTNQQLQHSHIVRTTIKCSGTVLGRSFSW
jgi:hypothetical protein